MEIEDLEEVAAEDQPEVEEAREEVTTRTMDEDLEMEADPTETQEPEPHPEEAVPHHEEVGTTIERDPREMAITVDPETADPEEAVIERTTPREESEAPETTPPEQPEGKEMRTDPKEETEEAPEETRPVLHLLLDVVPRIPMINPARRRELPRKKKREIELDQAEEREPHPDLTEETTSLREAEVETSPQTKEIEETR